MTNATVWASFLVRSDALFSGCHYIETAISPDSAIQRAMDNYMTTHFSADDFIWSFQAKLGNVWKRLGWVEIFSKIQMDTIPRISIDSQM